MSMDYKELEKSAFKHATVFRYEGKLSKAVELVRYGKAIVELLARTEAAEAAQETLQKEMAEYKVRAEKAERGRDAAIQYMRKTFGWCTGCEHFTGIYGSGCKIGEMSTCGEENNRYVFCKEE